MVIQQIARRSPVCLLNQCTRINALRLNRSINSNSSDDGCDSRLSKQPSFKQWTSSLLPRQDGYLQIGQNRVFAWSISGLETCVVVKNKTFTVCFDLGMACRQTVGCDKVFISHGHMDHISAVPQHAAKRGLYGLRPANYYVPEHLESLTKEVCHGFFRISETTEALERVNIIPVKVGDRIQIQRGCFLVPFPTIHRVRSQGYILYKNERSKKPEFESMSGKEVAQKVHDGVQVFKDVAIPEVAYTGDTTFEVFKKSPPADLFKVKLLIVEATYIDDEPNKDMVAQARQRGHIHLFEIVQNADLFKDVEHILLIHFSDKYTTRDIYSKVYKALPESLLKKVTIAMHGRKKS